MNSITQAPFLKNTLSTFESEELFYKQSLEFRKSVNTTVMAIINRESDGGLSDNIYSVHPDFELIQDIILSEYERLLGLPNIDQIPHEENIKNVWAEFCHRLMGLPPFLRKSA